MRKTTLHEHLDAFSSLHIAAMVLKTEGIDHVERRIAHRGTSCCIEGGGAGEGEMSVDWDEV